MSELANDSLIADEMRALVGQTMFDITSYPIAASDIRRWAIAIYYPEMPPPVFWDEEHAAKTRWGGIIAAKSLTPSEPRG